MNPDQIYRVLENALPNLKLKYHQYANKEQPYDYIFSDLISYKEAYNTVKQFAPFLINKDTGEDLDRLITGANGYSTFTSEKKMGVAIMYSASLLEELVRNYINYLEPIILNNGEEYSVDIKFPSINDLEELEKTINQLRRSLNFPVYELGGRVEIQNIKSGSIWIEILIVGGKSTLIMSAIGSLIYSAVALRNKLRQGDLFIEHARTLELKNDMLELIVAQTKQTINSSKEAEAIHIANEFLSEKRNEPETIQNLKGSIEAFNLLIEKGAEFYPSLKAPVEAKEKFPDFKIANLIESVTKLLSEGGNKND